MPADHHMTAPSGFWDAVGKGVGAANDGEVVTLGINADGPETGYGYIQAGEPMGQDLYKIKAFKEKPDFQTAQQYLEAGNFFWNAGIFLFRADAMIREFSRHSQDILSACEAALSGARTEELAIYLDAEAFRACRSEPVDIEIMERTDRAVVVAPVHAGWDDVGSWAALSDIIANTTKSDKTPIEGDVVALDCTGGLIRSDGPFVAALGLKDIVVIATGDAVLVADKAHAQAVKVIVGQLKEKGRDELL